MKKLYQTNDFLQTLPANHQEKISENPEAIDEIVQLVRPVFGQIIDKKQVRPDLPEKNTSPYNNPRANIFGNRLENIFTDYACSIPKIPAGQVLPLVREAKAGDKKAAERLAGAYFRLISSEARKRRHRISWDELISAGLYGLALAIDGFREDRGGNFGLFVKWRIKAEMNRACLEQSNNFNIPVARLQIYFQAQGELSEDGNFDPDHEEIVAKVREIAKEREKPDKWMLEFSTNDSKRIARIMTPILSLDGPNRPSDNPNGHPNGPSLFDFYSKETYKKSRAREAEEITRNEQIKLIRQAMEEVCDPRERRVMEGNQLCNDDDQVSLIKLGGEFGVSGERARQYKASAIKKIKAWMTENGHVMVSPAGIEPASKV